MSEVNEGVQIILNRMESNPEEFFGDSTRWNWIFKETMREVMSEQEKAAIHAGMVKIRRLEITAKAAATVLRANEMNERDRDMQDKIYPMGAGFGVTTTKSAGSFWGGKK